MTAAPTIAHLVISVEFLFVTLVDVPYNTSFSSMVVNYTYYIIIRSKITVYVIMFQATSEGIGNADYKSATSIYDFTVTDIDGNQVSLEKYR